MKHLALLLGTAGLALAPSASAQSFNIDVSATFGTPAATFGAGAVQPGTWNSVLATPGVSPLVDLAGAATSATITCVGAGSYDLSFNNTATTGDDEKLMDDCSDPTAAGATWTIGGIAPGNYVLYTYAWAPDSATYFSMVAVAGSSDPAQAVGGTWNGTYTPGLTHAVHHITVAPGGSVGMNITVSMNFATLNGFQLVAENSTLGIVRCEPGLAGVVPCPCANPPSGSGRGCDNSSTTGGASITGSGSPTVASDTLSFTTAGEKPSATSILMQGTTLVPAGLTFGQGLRCAGGALKRLYTAGASGGSITVPPLGGPTVSARSAALGDPISPGQNRYYLVYYRDPIVLGGCPAASTFNCTFTLEIAWL